MLTENKSPIIFTASSSLSEKFAKSFSRYFSALRASARENLLIKVCMPLSLSNTTAIKNENTSRGKTASFAAWSSVISDL